MPSKSSLPDFLAFCKQVLPASYAQRFQDLWALWETGLSPNGYFVEFGALNGQHVSNTYLLERLGWQGIVAEPHPNYETMLRANRNCFVSTKCVYSESGQTVQFKAVLGKPALSRLASLESKDTHESQGLRQRYNEVSVETVSLHDLLVEAAAPRVIDFLSIDTEGSEPMILEAFDFSSYTINCICVEHNDVSRERLYDLLTSHGYKRKWIRLSGHDDWYVKRNAYPDQFQMSVEDLVQSVSGWKVENNLDKRFALLQQITEKVIETAQLNASKSS
jgi:FkbM family methyltransferase